MDPLAILILLLVGVTLLKILWPTIEGIFKSIFELVKVVLVLVLIGGGIALLANAL